MRSGFEPGSFWAHRSAGDQLRDQQCEGLDRRREQYIRLKGRWTKLGHRLRRRRNERPQERFLPFRQQCLGRWIIGGQGHRLALPDRSDPGSGDFAGKRCADFRRIGRPAPLQRRLSTSKTSATPVRARSYARSAAPV